MVYLITYDLRKPGQDYSQVHETIKSFGDWWHYLESTWLVDTIRDADYMTNQLSSKIDSNDSLLVIKVTRPYNGWLTQEAWNWINSHL